MLFTSQIAQQMILCPTSPISVSLDLGKTKTTVVREGDTFICGDIKLTKKELEKLKDHLVYVYMDGKLRAVSFFSEDTNLFYSMKPTKDWPTFLLSSTPMHRFSKVSPKEDTMMRLSKLKPFQGRVLDTCCGFGYTAIAASKFGTVDTYERDPNVLRLAEFNPYSEELFTSKNITLHKEDFVHALPKIPPQNYHVLIHDPPTPKLSPYMFSTECYEELYRILKKNGKAYFYAPAPQKQAGREYYIEMVKRLKRVGFVDVVYDEPACGIYCKK